MDFIKRHAGKAVTKLANSFPVVLVTGPRQVGKTTLLQNIPKPKKTAYISFDNPLELASAREDPGTFLSLFGPPAVLDEIQYIPELFPYLKIEADTRKQKGLYYLTGSQQFHLMKNVSESLAGRVGILQLLGLSLRECAGDSFSGVFLPNREYLTKRSKTAPVHTPVELWKLIHRGFFPAVVTGYSDQKNFFESYIRTYVERDVRALAQVGDELQFMQFITIAAARSAQLLNYRDMARDVGISEPTAKKWISILVSSGLVYLLPSYSVNVEKRTVKTPKMYFLDTGLAAHLTGWTTPTVLSQGAAAGAFFESFAIAEILKSYYNAGIRPALYYYRDKDQKEVDLLILENGRIHPLEIKKTASPKKDDLKNFKALSSIKGMTIAPGGLICMGGFGILDSEGGNPRFSIPVSFL
jgi:predicted AAA+ superfamily ATPase